MSAWYGITYLCNRITTHNQSRCLRSIKQDLLTIPQTKYKKFGDRAFSYAASTSWSNLPTSLRTIDDLSLFKSELKTYVFKLSYDVS